ncbi:MAG: acylphosphatase [Aquificota bacterium]|nr:acylphosphatase [Aquificota bacterium]
MRLRIFLSGVVQGVGFRAYTQRVGESYGLSGWVRNLPDGRVEVLVEGDEEVLFHFIKDLWKGPRSSRVDRMEIVREATNEPLRGFTVRY